MSSMAEAAAALRARAESQIAGLSLFWQDEANVLPRVPAPFVFFELATGRARLVGFGGGRGRNLYRTTGELVGYVFWRRGEGLAVGLAHGERVAAAFRSWRSDAVSCFGATVQPVREGDALVARGVSSPAGNYSCVAVAVALSFDQVG